MKLAILGASGRSGRHLVHQALEAGHDVRVLVRSGVTFGLRAARLEVLVGDAENEAAVRELVSACDALVSALGPRPDSPEACSKAARNVVASGVARYVAISGAGLDVPGDQKDHVGKVVSFFVRNLSPAIFQDKVREYQILAASPLAWTLVRPPRLIDAPRRGRIKTSLLRCPGQSISRADLAAFCLECIGDERLVGKAPFVSG